MKKILVVTTKFPFPIKGASESERAYGLKQLLSLGFEVKLITKIPLDKIINIESIKKELGIDIFPISYRFNKSFFSKFKKYLVVLFTNWGLFDGAALEYSDPKLIYRFKKILVDWQPNIVWFDTSFMWYLIRFINRKKVKVIVRSQAFEASHFLEEEGMSFKNFIIYLAKFHSEKKSAKLSDLVLSITPEEEKIYKKLGAKKVINLPLRSLPYLLKSEKIIKKDFPLNIFFAGSTYGVKHNKKALNFLLTEIIPNINKQVKNKFIFNIFGRKFPKEYKKYLVDNVKYHGFVDNYESIIEKMDIALIPVLAGRGMQQKIFEPLVRGIPTITSARGLAGYSFKNNKEILYANTKEEFIYNLISLQDFNLRFRLSKASLNLSKNLFSKKIINKTILNIIKFLD